MHPTGKRRGESLFRSAEIEVKLRRRDGGVFDASLMDEHVVSLLKNIPQPPPVRVETRRTGCGSRIFSCRKCERELTGSRSQSYGFHYAVKHLRVVLVDLTRRILLPSDPPTVEETLCPRWELLPERTGDSLFTDERFLIQCIRLATNWSYDRRYGTRLPIATVLLGGPGSLAHFCPFCAHRGTLVELTAHMPAHLNFHYSGESHTGSSYVLRDGMDARLWPGESLRTSLSVPGDPRA